MLFLDGPGQHGHFPGAARHQREPSPGGVDVCDSSKSSAKPPHFHAQPCTMRVVDDTSAERTRQKHFSRDITGPGFGEGA